MIYAIVILSIVVLLLLYALYSISNKLLRFDSLFHLLFEDIEINLKYLNKLLQTPLLCNSIEVQTMHKNIAIIAKRLNEFASQMHEITDENKD